MTIPRGRRGHTLAEMMVTVAVIGILMLVGPALLRGIQNFFLMTTARNDIQRDARSALDAINRFLRQAKASTVQVDSPANQGPYSRITFNLVDGRVVQFYQSGNQLVQSVKSGSSTSTITLTSNLAYIAFTYPRSDDPSIISVAITMGRNIQLGKTKVLELTIQKVRIMNS